MRSRIVGAAAFLLLLCTFIADVLTPQTLVVAILLDVPIVLAALTRSRRLTATLVACALGADAAAAFMNAARDGRWDAIGVGDRLLSMLSIALVGYLSTAVQERAERVGRLASQEARARREATLSAAADRIRSSLSYDVVIRGILREAARALDGAAAYWYPAEHGELLRHRADADEVHVVDERPAPEIASLVHRVLDDNAAVVVRAVDPVGRFVLDRLAAPAAIAVPLRERGNLYGVLLVAQRDAEVDDGLVAAARGYAAISVNALAQSQLFGELAARNEALSERQAVIRDLVAAISHDVRTPLAALSMTLRQAADGAYGVLPATYGDVLRDSLVAIDDLQRLAETLLLVARFESGEHHPEQVVVELDALARELGSEMHALASARGVQLTVEADRSVRARGSRADLRRAAANLVANALAHTPGGGTVTIAVHAGGDEAVLRVADDGFGVERAIRAQLFERFSGETPGGGTGLGLYIVRRIAEQSRGCVTFEENRPRGSVFTIRLPVAAA